MEDIDTFPGLTFKRLYTNFGKIKNTTTSSTGVLNLEDIPLIEEYINDSLPKDEREHAMYSIVRNMYRKNPKGFFNFIAASNMHNLVLWTEASVISRQFRLYGTIYIEWDKTSKVYRCREFKRKDTKQNKEE